MNASVEGRVPLRGFFLLLTYLVVAWRSHSCFLRCTLRCPDVVACPGTVLCGAGSVCQNKREKKRRISAQSLLITSLLPWQTKERCSVVPKKPIKDTSSKTPYNIWSKGQH